MEAPLGLTPIRIGTSAVCELCSVDPRISRVHAELRLEPAGIVFRDLGSKNGSSFGGLRVREAELLPDTVLELGGSTLRLVTCAAPRELPLHPGASFGGALGVSLVMRHLFWVLARAAASDISILLWGESGTGKEVLARAIHDASPRAGGPFAVFDCGAVTPGLVESQLFGHEKGAFTGATSARVGLLESAAGGTLFLDELGELSLELQTRLLRAVETKRFTPVGAAASRASDVRIVSATHRDLHARIGAGQFRRDLFYRLAAVEASIPPLRDRREDLPLLVESFLAAQTPSASLAEFPTDLLALLTAHSWPGNVRELMNTLTRLRLMPELAAEAIAPPRQSEGAPLAQLPLAEAREKALRDFERWYLSTKLAEYGGKVAGAAEAMGVSRQLVYRLLARNGLLKEKS